MVEHWTLAPDELALLGNKARATRLGFNVLLKVFQHEGTFPSGEHEVSPFAGFQLANWCYPASGRASACRVGLGVWLATDLPSRTGRGGL